MKDKNEAEVEVFETENSRYMCEYEVLGNQEARRGRPRFSVPERQLIGLYKLHFTWKAISKIVGVSERIIHRRRAECSSSVCDRSISVRPRSILYSGVQIEAAISLHIYIVLYIKISLYINIVLYIEISLYITKLTYLHFILGLYLEIGLFI
jgi:hypothetical protein